VQADIEMNDVPLEVPAAFHIVRGHRLVHLCHLLDERAGVSAVGVDAIHVRPAPQQLAHAWRVAHRNRIAVDQHVRQVGIVLNEAEQRRLSLPFVEQCVPRLFRGFGVGDAGKQQRREDGGEAVQATGLHATFLSTCRTSKSLESFERINGERKNR